MFQWQVLIWHQFYPFPKINRAVCNHWNINIGQTGGQPPGEKYGVKQKPFLDSYPTMPPHWKPFLCDLLFCFGFFTQNKTTVAFFFLNSMPAFCNQKKCDMIQQHQSSPTSRSLLSLETFLVAVWVSRQLLLAASCWSLIWTWCCRFILPSHYLYMYLDADITEKHWLNFIIVSNSCAPLLFV